MTKKRLTKKTMKEYFLGIFNTDAFAQNDDGLEILTTEQRDTIASQFGQESVSAIESTILNLQTSSESENPAEFIGAIANELGSARSIEKAYKVLQTEHSVLQSSNNTLQEQVTTLSTQGEVPPPAMGVSTGAAPKKFTIDSSSSHNQFAVSNIASRMQGNAVFGATESTIEVAELKKAFGTYLSQGTKIEIIKQYSSGFTSAPFFTKTQAITEYRATQALITSVVQQFSNKWTARGKAKFTPIVIRNRRHKVNFSIIPAEVADSWLMYLYSENMSPDQMPITKYIIDNILMPSILNDIEMLMIGKGKYKELGVDEIGTPSDTMDGIETILVEANKVKDTAATTNINFYKPQVAINLLTATDEEVRKFIDEFAEDISPLFQNIKMPVCCSREVFIKYCRGHKAKWAEGSGINDSSFQAKFIDFTNFSLRPMDCLYGSPIVFSTPKENFKLLDNINTPQNLINDVQKHDYEFRLYGEFWMAVGLAIGEAVFAYVPADYDPQAKISGDPTNLDRWTKGTGGIVVAEVVSESGEVAEGA